MLSKRLLVIGNGMPDARMVDEILDRKVVEKDSSTTEPAELAGAEQSPAAGASEATSRVVAHPPLAKR
jgi:hypothetical protein